MYDVGKTVAIVASGPSATRKDCELLIKHNIPIIAVNSSWQLVPECQYIFAGDYSWWDNNHKLITTKAEKWTSSSVWLGKAKLLKQPIKHFKETSLRNSGAKAIKLAEHLGYTTILLVGFDCSLDDGNHWHPDHTHTRNPTQQSIGLWQKDYEQIKINSRVINCSRKTTITRFTRKSLESVLEGTMKPKCIIVGSGPSAQGFIPPEDITVISVNGSIEWLSRADYWFSLDDSLANQNRAKNPKHGVKYYTAGWRYSYPHVTNLQRINEATSEPLIRNSPEWWLWRWGAKKGLCENPYEISTGNSAYGAVNLAYHLGFRDIAVIGVDATREARIEGGQCKNLSHLPLLMNSVLSQVNLVSCGKLNSIPQMTFEEWYNQ